MGEIVLSYKVHNRKQVIQYYHELKNRNLDVWFDQLIPKKACWKDTIKRHIKNCDMVICFISNAVLLDDWVYEQVLWARKWHKPIYFLLLEEIFPKQFKKFKMTQVVHSVKEIDFEKYVISLNPLKHYQQTCKEIRRGQTLGFFLIFLFAILTSYIFCYGIDWQNLHLSYQYGYLTLGLMVYFILTYLPFRWCYVVNCICGVALLGVSLFVYPAYYISDISINSVFFLLFFILGSYLRYFKWKNMLDFILDTLATIFIYASIVSVMIVFEYTLNHDISYLSIPIFILYLLWGYKKRNSYFKAYEKNKQIEREYQI